MVTQFVSFKDRALTRPSEHVLDIGKYEDGHGIGAFLQSSHLGRQVLEPTRLH
jgi:hypothetical protein